MKSRIFFIQMFSTQIISLINFDFTLLNFVILIQAAWPSQSPFKVINKDSVVILSLDLNLNEDSLFHFKALNQKNLSLKFMMKDLVSPFQVFK